MSTLKELKEMAHALGASMYSRLDTNVNNYRNEFYKLTHKNKIVSNVNGSGSGVNVHRHITKENGIPVRTEYHTNDHDSKETLHNAVVSYQAKTDKFPYEHEVQKVVERVKSNDRLPNGHATNVIYDHFKKSKYPLRSDSNQYTDGHKMWHRLVDKALDNGHHVYHWDGKQLQQTIHENKAKHLTNSFGNDDVIGLKKREPHEKFENHHMIISKNPLI
jgi:hypothetical protein